MREFGAFEAKNKLAALLNDVERGEQIVITRCGRAVAILGPVVPGFDHRKAAQATADIIEMRNGVTLGNHTIKELIEDGRR